MVRSETGASWAFRFCAVGAIVIHYVVGRHQWFVRDDWDYVVGRDILFRQHGWQHWLLDPQGGHWLSVPVLIFHYTSQWFGLGSYWPFLVPTLAAHFAAVLLIRVLCRRVGVTPWTTTALCSMLLVFGAGWENMVLAIQISVNLSLLAFLAQLVLVDHDGPPDRRDVVACVLGVVGIMSSGYGPIFAIGTFVFLALRRRWVVITIVAAPSAVLYAWWFAFWETDNASRPGRTPQIPLYIVRELSTAFDGLVSVPGLGAVAMIATLTTVLRSRLERRQRDLLITFAATVLIIVSVIGVERVGLGDEFATSSRYADVIALIIGPALALTIDHLGRVTRELRLAGLAVIAASATINLGTLATAGGDWARQTAVERTTFELIAGSSLAAPAGFDRPIFSDTPTIRPSTISELVRRGAIQPRGPVTAADMIRVRQALGLP